MPHKPNSAAARARAEALFKPRPPQPQEAVPTAMSEYKAAEVARFERTRELKALRLARATPKRDG